ncbi:MAG TPA: serine/threonine-protein kinase [Gemmataceae bacterium]|nr:serine/threonine-protein kinase [Gemmataceae bacterium]
MPSAPTTAKDLSQLIVRSRLMTADEVADVQRRVPESARPADDLEAFRKHLVTHKLLTEYQAALLLRGHSEGFFLDQYRILELLAKGRMAGVYKAVHASGQVVAIKVLPASKARDPEVLARFRREARLLTRLDHSNVVRAFQLGESAGKHFLVMEYLDGDTLDEFLEKRKRLSPVEAVRIVHEAMLGLQQIHERGMIHRDLKPANLMLVETGKKDDDLLHRPVKILDIGLGKAVFDEKEKSLVDDPSQLTTDGVLIGTPDYLAPEQARSARSADTRADIYSLGCVLYHALTGQPPFPDPSVLNQVMRHATEPPRPLSDFLSQVPDGLQNVLNWMMAKDPAQRYPTPDRAAQALQLFLRNTPAPASAPSPLPAFVKWLESGGEPETAKPVGIPVGKLEPSSPRRSEPPRPPEPRKAVPVPAIPVGSPPVAVADFDVELVSVPDPRRSGDQHGLLELNRRDAIMLATGGTLVFAAIAAGWGLSRVLRRQPTQDSQQSPPPVDPGPATPPEG